MQLSSAPIRIIACALASIAIAGFARKVVAQSVWRSGIGQPVRYVQAVQDPTAGTAAQETAQVPSEALGDDLFGGIDLPSVFAPQPMAPTSSLLAQLDAIAAPISDTIVFELEPMQIDTVQLTRSAHTTTGNSGVRRSQVSVQPVVRGFQQQAIYGQYQGAQFLPVRFDLDSILASIDPGIIDNLTIIPGPYGVEYGPGLAFIDVTAKKTPRSEFAQWAAETSLLYRSNGDQFYGRETLTLAGPDYGVRASYGHKVGSDYESGNGTKIPSSYNVNDVNVVVSWDVQPESTLQFEYLYQGTRDTEFAGLAFDARQRNTDGFFAKYETTSSCLGDHWQVEGWYNRTTFEGDTLNNSKQDFYQVNPVFVPAGSFAGFTNADALSSGFRTAATWGESDTGQLIVGNDLHVTEQELNEFDDFTAFAAPPFVFDNYPVRRGDIVDVGVFAKLTTPTRWDTKLTTGVRADWVHTHQDRFHEATDPQGLLHVDDSGADFDKDMTLYHAFVSIDKPLSNELNLRMGFGHGARPPSITELFSQDPYLTLVQNATTAALGDELLNPEQASQFDIALIGSYSDVEFQLAGYWTYINEHITLEPDPGIPPDPDLRLLNFANDDAIITGAELSAQLPLTETWLATAQISYVDGRNVDRQEPLPSIFPLNSRFSLLWHDPVRDAYGIEFVATVVDNQDRIASSLLEATTPGFAKFDVRSYWRVTDQFRVTAGFENIGDRNYLEHLSVHNPQVLEPGLNFYLATRFKY